MMPPTRVGAEVRPFSPNSLLPISTRARGDVMFSPLIIGHRLMESIAGSPAAAALWSVGSTPARCANVAYQSQTAANPSWSVPRTFSGKKPPETKLAPTVAFVTYIVDCAGAQTDAALPVAEFTSKQGIVVT